MIIRTTEEVLNNPWGKVESKHVYPERTPMKWYPDCDLNFEDVTSWEEIFYQPGLIGVYVSWDPYEEYYILVHNLHLDRKHIEIYKGNDGVEELVDRCRSIGVTLPEIKIKPN